MFCIKCGEAISDGSVTCPKCGANLKEADDEQAVVYASQKELQESDSSTLETVSKRSFYIWCSFAIVSLIILAFNYLKVSVELYFAGSSDTNLSGYGLLECLNGTVRTSGYMVIVLIITNISVFITGIIGAKGNIVKTSVLKGIMVIESLAYLITTIIPYFNIKKVLEEFNSEITTAKVGIGCYLNIILAIVACVYYFINIYKNLKDE